MIISKHNIHTNQELFVPRQAMNITAATTLTVLLACPAVVFSQDTRLPSLQKNARQIENNNSSTDNNRRRNTLEKQSSNPSLTGYGNNHLHPEQGTSGSLYARILPADYADGLSAIKDGPELRYISNRIFADGSQNLFSENSVTQWAYNWGQFIDHTIGLKTEGSEQVEIAFNESDPLEFFTNSAQNLMITRSIAAENTGISSPREQENSVSSYIDAWAVYGGTEERLEWLREGPVDGDMSNNGAKLLLTDTQNLPPASLRGDASSAPVMERVGMLRAIPNADDVVVIAGDLRANENIALTTVQTLFAREHNRLVDLLPEELPEQSKFDIARRFIIATQQYITYNEFLPALGMQLDTPSGYKPDVDPTVTHEFATVGYRAHSMIHGEIEMEVSVGTYSESQLQEFRAQGIEIDQVGDELELAVPLNVAFANPQLTASLGIGAIAAGLALEPQYNNDETIDNQLRSILFQLPNPDIENPDECLDGPTLPACFLLASDLGVMDIFRTRDHGISDYNSLREAYGLERVESFTDITGESTEEFPTDDPLIDSGNPIDDPEILDYVLLQDLEGNELTIGSEAADTDAVVGKRRSTLAARLKAIYGDVNSIDAFTGMVSEPHVGDSEFGELQYAMWKTQFQALRDGDSNFYLWNNDLKQAMRNFNSYGLDYRQSLADIIVNNTDLDSADVHDHMFLSAE